MNDRDVINDILADDWLDIPIFLRDKVNARADRLLARAEAAEARVAELEAFEVRSMTDFDDTLNEIMNYGETGQSLALSDMYVAALARAEAAITESNSAARRAFNAEVENQRLTKEAGRLRARAEAAEAEAIRQARLAVQARMRHANLLRRRGLEEPLTTVENEAEAAGLRARVAELEAQLAAQGWRPVTEKPDKPGWYVVYDSDGHVFYNADIFPYRVARWTGKWDSALNGLVDYWRPLPPAPAPQEPTP